MTSVGRVLVVEDSEPHRYIVSSWLQRAGYAVVEAATGAEGLDRAATGIDVAVLDVHLPDMSGRCTSSTATSMSLVAPSRPSAPVAASTTE